MCAYLDVDCCVNQNLAAIIPSPSLDGRYLQNALTQAYGIVRDYGRGASQGALNCDIVADMKIPLPPLAEQRSISGRLRKLSTNIEEAAQKIVMAIGRLQEYRAALISAAVTGQIDVRAEV